MTLASFKSSRFIRRNELRHSVSIQRRQRTRDAHGGMSESWETQATRWAKIDSVSGGEGDRGNLLTAEATHLITLDFYSGLTRDYRIKFGSRVFNIALVRDVEQRGIVHECECEEVRQ